jgi:type VI secretion system protein ImpB
MAESHHERLKRVRKPRVHITYDVETEGAQKKRELPFVVGVLGDFSGHPTQKLERLENREFVEISRDNFDAVLAGMNAGLNLRVKDTIGGKGEFAINLAFKKFEDFEPGNLVQQVDPLRKLMEHRDKLRQLQSAVDRSPDLEEELEKALRDTEELINNARLQAKQPESGE